MTHTPALGAEQRAVVAALQRCSDVHYDFTLDLVDTTGAVLSSLSPVATGSPNVSRDCTARVAGRIDVQIDTELVWGKDRIAPCLLVSSPQYSGGEVQRFPLGVYVATTPSKPLRTSATSAVWNVVAYGLPYLLQKSIEDSYAAEISTYYSHHVAAILELMGIEDAALGDGSLNPAVVTFPADWAVKTLPVDKGAMIFLVDDSTDYQGLDVINKLLEASGMQPIYDDQLGNFVISEIPKPESESILYTLSQGATEWEADFARTEALVSADLNMDAWNLPNRFIFIQSGLTFEPSQNDGSDGRYVIDNALSDPTHYRPPSDQDSLGRVVSKRVTIDASGQADLIKQAEKLYTDAFASAETLDLKTAPWPCAWHFDVFRFASPELPRTNQRKCQTQSWTLSLRGEAMTWKANAVSEGEA